MRSALAVFVVAAICAIPADAAFIRMFFAPEGVGKFDPLAGVHPTYGNPRLPGGGRLYIWAETPAPNPPVDYIQIGYNILATGSASIINHVAYDDYYTAVTPGEPFPTYRWRTWDNGTLLPQFIGNVRLASPPAGYYGVRNSTQGLVPDDPHFYTDGVAGGHRDVLLGYVDVTGSGDLFLQVGDLGIIRAMATWEPVYFGFGDEGDGLTGNSRQMGSSLSDATVGSASNGSGDLNCDGAFDGADIWPFFIALGDPAQHAAEYPDCDIKNGDMNGDGAVDGADIQPFFDRLGGG